MKHLIMVILFSITFFFCSAQTVCEVREELQACGVKHVDIVLKQSILETGWYKSRICNEYNNIFGFWYKSDYLKFECWQDCVVYYKEWQDRHFNYRNCNDYYDFLIRKGYAEDPEYINKLKSICV